MRGLPKQPAGEILQRSVQRGGQLEQGEACRALLEGRGTPDHVEHNIFVGRIVAVFMLEPVGRLWIDLDISGLWSVFADLDHGISEVGSRLAIEETGVQNEQRLTVGSP